MSRQPLSDPEKLDAVYRMLRADQRRRNISFFVRIGIFASIVVLYLYVLPHTDFGSYASDFFQERVAPHITGIAADLAVDMQDEIMRSMLQSSDVSAIWSGSAAKSGTSETTQGRVVREWAWVGTSPSDANEGANTEHRSAPAIDIEAFRNLSRGEVEAILDRMPADFLSSLGVDREVFLSQFPE